MVLAPSPRVAFATTCRGRRAHLEETLPRNLQDNPNARFVLVDYGSEDGLADYVVERHRGDIESGQLGYYRTEAPYFRMAHAKNMAHRIAICEGGDILVNLDADNFTGPGFASYLVDKFQEADAEGEAIFMRARESHTGPGPGAEERMPWGCGGRIAVTRQAFLQAGGYDEAFVHWSPDDKDFCQRLQRLGWSRWGIRREFLRSVPHGDEVRFASQVPGAPQSMGDTGAAFTLRGREQMTVANWGQIGLGEVRGLAGEPVEIGPVPTRVFGLGMQKTATTSLAAALRILGFDCAHWESPQWARYIVNQFGWGRRSPTLEAYYCAVDLPVPVFFRELDRAYPGSKFILTIRDEIEWLRSARQHWERFYHRDWEFDGYSHEMHERMYGQREFDALVFLERYRRHNAEVREWFSWRPNDLLVMDMSAGAGWPELAGFLGTPIPSAPYPREFATPRARREPGCYPE